MDIGEEKKEYVFEPVELPGREDIPVVPVTVPSAPAPAREEEPVGV